MIIMCRYTLGTALLGSYIYQLSNPYSILIHSKPQHYVEENEGRGERD